MSRPGQISIAAAALSAAFCVAGAGASAQDAITVAFYGGEWGEAIQKCIVDPFVKATGIKATPEPGVSTVTLGKLRQQKDKPAIDVAWIDGGVSELAGGDGLAAAIDPAVVKGVANMIPEGVYKLPDGKIYALSTGFYALGLVYNTKELKSPPTSWWDLWKAEFNGLSTVPSPSNAMGVPLFVHIAKISGGGFDNLDPAVKRYKDLKVGSFFDTSGGATNNFQSGQVIIGGHYASAAWSLADKGLPIAYAVPKEGAPAGDIRVHIVKGGKEALAARFVDFAIGVEPATCMSSMLYVGPATKGVSLSGKALERMPWGKDGTVANLALYDWGQINARRQQITDLWNKEVVRK